MDAPFRIIGRVMNWEVPAKTVRDIRHVSATDSPLPEAKRPKTTA